jgi:hypothetical protein
LQISNRLKKPAIRGKNQDWFQNEKFVVVKASKRLECPTRLTEPAELLQFVPQINNSAAV